MVILKEQAVISGKFCTDHVVDSNFSLSKRCEKFFGALSEIGSF